MHHESKLHAAIKEQQTPHSGQTIHVPVPCDPDVQNTKPQPSSWNKGLKKSSKWMYDKYHQYGEFAVLFLHSVFLVFHPTQFMWGLFALRLATALFIKEIWTEHGVYTCASWFKVILFGVCVTQFFIPIESVIDWVEWMVSVISGMPACTYMSTHPTEACFVALVAFTGMGFPIMHVLSIGNAEYQPYYKKWAMFLFFLVAFGFVFLHPHTIMKEFRCGKVCNEFGCIDKCLSKPVEDGMWSWNINSLERNPDQDTDRWKQDLKITIHYGSFVKEWYKYVWCLDVLMRLLMQTTSDNFNPKDFFVCYVLGFLLHFVCCTGFRSLADDTNAVEKFVIFSHIYSWVFPSGLLFVIAHRLGLSRMLVEGISVVILAILCYRVYNISFFGGKLEDFLYVPANPLVRYIQRTSTILALLGVVSYTLALFFIASWSCYIYEETTVDFQRYIREAGQYAMRSMLGNGIEVVAEPEETPKERKERIADTLNRKKESEDVYDKRLYANLETMSPLVWCITNYLADGFILPHMKEDSWGVDRVCLWVNIMQWVIPFSYLMLNLDRPCLAYQRVFIALFYLYCTSVHVMATRAYRLDSMLPK